MTHDHAEDLCCSEFGPLSTWYVECILECMLEHAVLATEQLGLTRWFWRVQSNHLLITHHFRQQFLSLIVLIHHSHLVPRHRASAIKIARESHYVEQHVLQYEYKCLFMDISDRSEHSFTMFFHPRNIGLETCYTRLSLILAELWRKIDFSLMVAIFGAITYSRHIWSLQEWFHNDIESSKHRLDTLIVELCALLAEIWRNIHFSVMASLMCIKMVCGTFCQLFNISNRFLWYFSNIETSIRNWFPGGARYPLLPAQLHILYEKWQNTKWPPSVF